jgi:hypothetical protein
MLLADHEIRTKAAYFAHGDRPFRLMAISCFAWSDVLVWVGVW